MNIMWTADIQMKWRCDHRGCDCDLSNRKGSLKNVSRATLRLLKLQSQLRSHLHFIRMSTVHIIFTCFIPLTGTMNPNNWPAPNVWVFKAQLVEQCSANAEAMGSNAVEAPKTFFGLTFRLLKSQSQLRWSHLHFISYHNVNIEIW